MPNLSGTIVLNYRLDRKIGEGGFGSVYLAVHETLGRQAAVKILHPEFARHAELIERFFNEAKAVCAIGHRAIIDIQNFGYLESGEPYYLMEFFPGLALSDFIEERGPLPPALLQVVMTPVVSALAAAHAKKIIHRDLKPENIMLLEEGGVIVDVKLLDFGIAKLVDSSDHTRSRTGVAMGTPQFMAPEQAKDSKNVDERADVYSLGATVFTCLAGRPPFVASNVTDLIIKIHTEAAPRLRSLVPTMSEALDAAVDQCLHKEPEGRPATIEAAWGNMLAAMEASPALVDEAPSKAAKVAKPQSTSIGVGVGLGTGGGTGPRSVEQEGHAPTRVVSAESGPGTLSPKPQQSTTKPASWLLPALALLLVAGVVAAMKLSGDPAPKASTALAAAPSSDASIATSPAIEPDLALEPPDIDAGTKDIDAGTKNINEHQPTVTAKEHSRSVDTEARPECSLLKHLGAKDPYKSANAARKRLELWRACLQDGLISESQFQIMSKPLEAQMANLQIPETHPALSSDNDKTGVNLRVFLPSGKSFSGTLPFKVNSPLLKSTPALLKRVAEEANAQGATISIGVHSDSEGNLRSNQRLTQSRANAIKRALVSAGVAGDKISAKGFGPNMPIASNSTPEGRAKNRRVEIQIKQP